MFGFPHARLVEDVVKNTRDQSASVANRFLDSEIRPCKLLNPTTALLNLATENLRKKENELIVLQGTCSSQSCGAQKARCTLECVVAYTCSRQGPVGCSKMTKESSERPLEYLREIARQYEREISLCEVTLDELFTRQITSDTEENMNRGRALRCLTASSSQTLSNANCRWTVLSNLLRQQIDKVSVR